MQAQASCQQIEARRIVVSGQVQGVGFRPFIYRLAQQHKLNGWVKNRVGVVDIHVQGEPSALRAFQSDIFTDSPDIAEPVLQSSRNADTDQSERFDILPSDTEGESDIHVPNDLFLCDDCLAEMNDPQDRRYRYPFINCTQCGPRYTLIRSLPYDRPNTTMASFELCPQCRAEYEDPADRRFHAEPVACPACGPSLLFNDSEAGLTVFNNNELALTKAVASLRAGKLIAVKGIGGYHLMCDASDDSAVSRLRRNKPRPDKPLAVMFPSPSDAPFSYLERAVLLDETEKSILSEPARPILLVCKKSHSILSEQIAPGLHDVGVLLPYSPLHHLLLDEFSGPLVATSANISGEPVLTENQQVENRLAHVADAYLHHDRPIERPADDPVIRMIAAKPRPIRLGRGCTPLELTLPFELAQPVIAVGAHMKNSVALAWKDRAVISPHIGEMGSTLSLKVFESTIKDLQNLYDVKAEQIICDAHPGYMSSRWAYQQGMPVNPVLHHHAHASAAYYETVNDERNGDDIIAFAWDGVGAGEQGELWGGETFFGKPGAWQRVASMRPFRLPGGDKAGREPWRSAAALCWETGQTYKGLNEIDPLVQQAWRLNINSPQTTSVGRLFDAATALSGVRQLASYEGQGPMELEFRCDRSRKYLELDLDSIGNLLITNWEPLVPAMIENTLSVAARASLFHASMAHAMLQQAVEIRRRYDVNTVALSGGVFQNKVLTEQAMVLLREADFDVHLPELLPVNDAGISFGQIIEHTYSTYLTHTSEVK